jgi:hypothetical protein
MFSINSWLAITKSVRPLIPKSTQANLPEVCGVCHFAIFLNHVKHITSAVLRCSCAIQALLEFAPDTVLQLSFTIGERLSRTARGEHLMKNDERVNQEEEMEVIAEGAD